MYDLNDLPDWESRWSIATVALEKHGMDTSKITNLFDKLNLLKRLEDDEVIGENDDVWTEWVNEHLRENPHLAKHNAFRQSNAKDLDDSMGHQSLGDDDDELAEGRYAVMSWYQGNTVLRSADSIEGVLDVIHGLHYVDEDPEVVEAYYDLDSQNCQRYEVTGGAGQLSVTITLALNGVEKTYTN